MKLRVKIRASGSRHSITVHPPEQGGDPTLEHVKSAIYHQIPSLPGVENADALILSLNGAAPLDNDDEDSTSDVGLVSGDLIHVLNGPNPSDTAAAPVAQPPQQPTPPLATLSSSTPSQSSGYVDEERANRSVDRLRPTGSDSHDRSENASNDRPPDSLAPVESEEFLPRRSYTLLNASEKGSHLISLFPCADYADGAQLPSLLRRVYDEEKPTSKIELIVVVLHVIFLEKNYTASFSDSEGAGASAPKSSLPLDWKRKAPNKLNVSYRHPKCGDDDDVEFLVTFINLFGNAVIVQAKARRSGNNGNESSETFKCQLKPDEFLTANCLTVGDSRFKYRDLRRLSNTLVDSVVHQLLNEGRSLAGLDAEDGDVSIFSLPYDCSIEIMSMLDFRSLARMACVNRFFRDYCQSARFLWKNLFVRDFSAIPVEGVDDWKKEYKETYLRRLAAEERRRQNPPPFWGDPLLPRNPFNDDDNPFVPAPFAPPGFLGGDRDLFPEGLPLPNDPFGFGGAGRGLFQPPRPPRPGLGPRFPGGPNPSRPRWPGQGGGGGYFF